MMSVAEILRGANSSGDLGKIDNAEDWFGILAGKVSHDHFDWLCDKIADEGFTVPIVLGKSIGDDGLPVYTIGNGHHRLCAAILLAIDEIPAFVMPNGWCWNDDSHDGDMRLDPPSFEYWELFRQNMEGLHFGDANAKAWRYQYNGRDDDEYDDDRCDCDDCNRSSSYCGDCDGNPCICYGPCVGCGAEDSAHRVACDDRGWDVLDCPDCGYGAHYRRNAPACRVWMTEQHAQALSEHRERGYLPVGAWHPVGVLTEAYDEHAEWVRDEEMRQARQAWQSQLQKVRDAAARGVGDYALANYVEHANRAYEVYAAL